MIESALSNLPPGTDMESVKEAMERHIDGVLESTKESLGDATDFLSQVDEVSRLIDGLKSGTVSPDYIDKKFEKSKEQEQKRVVEDKKKKEEEEKRLEAAKIKVKEIQANIERKNKAREKYARWVESQRASSQGRKATTDYTAWDLWLPSDEEDEMIRDLTPSGPEFKAMEKDIEERHRKMKKQRQVAERRRVEGNEAFRKGQFSLAYQRYAEGLECHKANPALHCNAAMASIKLGCYVQAIEHCDRVLGIQEFLLDNMRDPLVPKALHRRAMARRALGHFSEAVEDLEKALEIDPANKEVREQLERARSELEEERKARKVAKAARGGPADGGDDGGHSDAGGAAGRGGCDEGPEEGRELRALRQVKGAAKAVWAAMAGPGPGGSESKGARFDPLGRRRGRREENTLGGELKALAEVVGRGESCRVHLRECGGLEALSEALKRISSGDVLAGLVPEDILAVMQQACLNDFNAEALVRYGAFEAAMRLVLSHQPSQGAQAVTEALTLLYTASTTPVVRESIAASAASLRAVGALVAHADRAPSLRARTAALAVLSQCMGSAALRKALVGGQAGAEAAEVVRSLSAAAGGPSAPGAEQACSALGNMFGDESLRGVGAAEGAASALLLTTRKHSGTAASGVRRAALGALANLLLDGTAAGSVTERGQAKELLGLTGDDDDVTASRALACVSRAVRTQQGAGVVVDIGGTAILTRALSRWAVRGREGEREMGLESCVRALALVESQRGESGAEMIEEGAVASLVAVVADKGVSDATAGNASVLIGQLAKAPEGARALADADGVKALVGAMLDRKGTAQRNAAVACAKAVQQRADLLERLKELHGIEIMYRYVRP